MTTALSTQTTPAAGFGLLLVPATLAEAHEFAGMLAKSDLVPKSYQNKPGDIMIAGAMGARLGLDVFTALAGIAVVNGRPTLYGDAMLAVCQSRPDFEDIAEMVKGQGDSLEATCTVKRKGRSPYVATFTAADAKRANLWGKQGPWTAMPQRMCQMRARSFALRGAFADALAGFHAREEIEDDMMDVTATATVRVPEAAPAKVREVEPMNENARSQEDLEDDAARAKAGQAPVTPQVIDTLARSIASEFKAVGINGIKEINAKFGVAKLSEIPAEKLEEVFGELRTLERILNENT
jgi:hypothetical protein